MQAVNSILITPSETLVDDGTGTVAHLLPSKIHILLESGELVDIEEVLAALANRPFNR